MNTVASHTRDTCCKTCSADTDSSDKLSLQEPRQDPWNASHRLSTHATTMVLSIERAEEIFTSKFGSCCLVVLFTSSLDSYVERLRSLEISCFRYPERNPFTARCRIWTGKTVRRVDAVHRELPCKRYLHCGFVFSPGESRHLPAETGVFNDVVTFTEEIDGWLNSAGRSMSACGLHILWKVPLLCHGRLAVPLALSTGGLISRVWTGVRGVRSEIWSCSTPRLEGCG